MESDSSEPQRRLGEGHFPPELDRVNWGAVLLSFLWTAVHGVWRWFFAVVGYSVVATYLSIQLNVFLLDSVVARAVFTLFVAAGQMALLVVLGCRANRIVWSQVKQRRARMSEAEAANRIDSVGRYVRNQRIWARTGLVLWLVGQALSFMPYSTRRLGLMPEVIDAVVAAAVLISLWWLDRPRRAFPAPS